MLGSLKKGGVRAATRIFGTKSERDMRVLSPMVQATNEAYGAMSSLSDAELLAKTLEFRDRLARGATPDDLLPEAFALVKEACRRRVGSSWQVVGQETRWEMVPYDVQIIGAVVLHQGKIAEMATGEGKTLVAVMPLYLNALSGKGCHLVTVNDYLARRDSEWVAQILRDLGLTVGVIQHDMDTQQRRAAYLCDVTYGTNNEFGFDYLRDNMVIRGEDRVQRGHHYTIVDEVDSVLVDEARTPLIISGPVVGSNQQFDKLRPYVENLVRDQNALVNRYIEEAKELLAKGDRDSRYEAGIRLLQVQHGGPKNKKFLKLVSEGDLKKLIQQVEADFMREKRLHEVDEDLLFYVDERGHTISTSDAGREKLAPPGEGDLFILPDLSEQLGEIDRRTDLSPRERVEAKEKLHLEFAQKSEQLANVQQLLRAYTLFEKDVEYVVQDGKVLIVDEFTGRLMPGRRYSDGLHQALEAKERVRVEGENQTLATITLQNYFRMYGKLAGMTGTAETEAAELYQIYKLDVTVIPTNEAVRRVDYDDLIYRTRREKYNAIIEEIEEMHGRGRPVLVGTVSVEVSETLSRMLKRRGIAHSVLNAKYHQQEAGIVALAGRVGAVTIATNMAGRGTDIKLAAEVVKGRKCLVNSGHGIGDCTASPGVAICRGDMPCGLHIVGTERHESRRIDRQLRGRSGRQGDPGSSRFFLSLEDDLMRLFGSERIAGIMDRLGVQEGEVITHPLVTRSIEGAQKRVEAQNFGIRKRLLEYDDVMNQQREVIYGLRNEVLDGADIRARVWEMVTRAVDARLENHLPEGSRPESWDLAGLQGEMESLIVAPVDLAALKASGRDEIRERCVEAAREAYAGREAVFGPAMREIERRVLLSAIDEKWRDHLHEIDILKEGIYLRAYAQKDPLLEYKGEAFRMFEEVMTAIEADTVKLLFRVVPVTQPRFESAAEGRVPGASGPPGERGATRLEPALTLGRPARASAPAQRMESHASMSAFGGGSGAPAAAGDGARTPQARPRVGRNDPCPCGSGKKYKKCCGASE
ncbi:MAG: preprotein translocase subunit SecA [Candidatus Eisenbacteria bacterium]|nr:preprotein translocase subunit SecA [Candidatus Eisenbacteria bacterium]